MKKNPSSAWAGPYADMLRIFTVAQVRSRMPDLNPRQLALLLSCYLEGDRSQTVCGLALKLDASRSAVSRALDRLEHFRLVKRTTDGRDRRIVRLAGTPKGRRFVQSVNAGLKAAAKKSRVIRR